MLVYTTRDAAQSYYAYKPSVPHSIMRVCVCKCPHHITPPLNFALVVVHHEQEKQKRSEYVIVTLNTG